MPEKITSRPAASMSDSYLPNLTPCDTHTPVNSAGRTTAAPRTITRPTLRTICVPVASSREPPGCGFGQRRRAHAHLRHKFRQRPRLPGARACGKPARILRGPNRALGPSLPTLTTAATLQSSSPAVPAVTIRLTPEHRIKRRGRIGEDEERSMPVLPTSGIPFGSAELTRRGFIAAGIAGGFALAGCGQSSTSATNSSAQMAAAIAAAEAARPHSGRTVTARP